eukprot:scaffold83_cov57-Cyclotella_meneghiniana.AAC.5
MFTKIFTRPQQRRHNDNNEIIASPAASIKSDDTPKSILRRQGSSGANRNFHRSVSWSTTYETLEHDDLDYSESGFEQYEGLEDISSYSTRNRTDTVTYDSPRCLDDSDREGFDSRFHTVEDSSTYGGDTFETQTTYETREDVVNNGFESRFHNVFTAESTFDETRQGVEVEESIDTRNVSRDDNGTTSYETATNTTGTMTTSGSLERSKEAKKSTSIHAQTKDESIFADEGEITSVNSQEGIEQTVQELEDITKAATAAAVTSDDKQPQEQQQESKSKVLNKPILNDNRNSSLRNIACAASNVTEASELLAVDRYGLDEVEAKLPIHRSRGRSLLLAANNSYVSEGEPLFDDKYRGLEDNSTVDGALLETAVGREKTSCEEQIVEKNVDKTPVEEEAVTTTAEEDAPLTTLELDVSHEEQGPLSPMSDVGAVNIFVPGEEAQPIEEHVIHEAPSDVLTIGSLSEEQPSFDEAIIKANSDDTASLASKKEYGYADLLLEQNAADKSMGHIGLILPFLNRMQCGAFVSGVDSFSMLDEVDSREWLEYATSTQDDDEEHDDDEEDEDNIHEMSCSVPNSELEDEVESAPSASYDNESVEGDAHEEEDEDEVEYQLDEDGNVRIRVNGEETSITSENEGSEESPEEISQDTSTTSEPISAHTGEVITFPIGEDDSIPSNESKDEPKRQSQTKKTGFKPLASFKKRISKIMGKNNKGKKQSKQAAAAPLSPNTTLHDRVYNNIAPETQSRVSTALILDDLEIIEKTAKVMYQDRFNCTPSFLNPVNDNENVEVNISVPRSKRGKDHDATSQQSKTTVESALSPVFRSYFATGND